MLCPKEDAFLPPGAHRGVHPGPSKTLKMSWRPHLPFKTGQTKHAQHQNKPTGGCERASWVNFECLQRPGAQTGVPWGPTHTTPPTCAVVSEPRTKTHPRVENPDYGVCLRDWTVLFLPVRRIEAGRAFPDWVFHFWSLTHGGVVVPKTAPKTNPRKEIRILVYGCVFDTVPSTPVCRIQPERAFPDWVSHIGCVSKTGP